VSAESHDLLRCSATLYKTSILNFLVSLKLDFSLPVIGSWCKLDAFITRVSWPQRKYVFDVHVTVHRDTFPYNKPTRCTNFSKFILEENSTCFGEFICPSSGVFHCTYGNGICHTGCWQLASEVRGPACKLSENLYDIYHCCVYSEKLLMDRGTVRNM
jgi:hypothetical protein